MILTIDTEKQTITAEKGTPVQDVFDFILGCPLSYYGFKLVVSDKHLVKYTVPEEYLPEFK